MTALTEAVIPRRSSSRACTWAEAAIASKGRAPGANVTVIIPESGELNFPTFAERVLSGLSIGASVFRRAFASFGVCGGG